MADRNHTQDEQESRRILDRVGHESDSGGFSHIGAARRHVEAGTPPDADPIEYWGTLIGRSLGLLITIAIVGWLLLYVFGGI